MKQIVTFQVGRLNTNCHLVVDGSNCVVIDVAYHCQQVVDYINTNNLQVIAILLTHGHFDHCGGVEELKRRFSLTKVPVYVHQLDADLCKCAQQNMWRIACENCFPTHFIGEGSLQIDDFTFQVVYTPGHTPGSVVYLMDDVMFSGDTLFYRSVGRTDLLGGDAAELTKSLQKLTTLQNNYQIYAGHGPCTTLKAELQHNPYLN